MPDPTAIAVTESPVATPADPANTSVRPPQDVQDDTDGFDFASFSEDAPEVDHSVEAPSSPALADPAPEPVPATPSPTPAPAAEPAATTAPAAAQDPATPAPTSTAPVQPTPAPASAPVDQATLQADYEKFVGQSVDFLEKNVYALSDETKEALNADPASVIPQLAARLHMQVLTTAVTQIANLVPVLSSQVMEMQARDRAAEDSFFQTYPQLKDHYQDVLRVAQVYKSHNPNAATEVAKREIAAMAMVSLGLTPQVTPALPSNVPPAVVPTSARGGAVSAPPPGSVSQWDELINED